MSNYGLKLKLVKADGNSFFRAIADQLEGDEKLHEDFRDDAVWHLKENADEYKHFLLTGEKWNTYLSRMKKPNQAAD